MLLIMLCPQEGVPNAFFSRSLLSREFLENLLENLFENLDCCIVVEMVKCARVLLILTPKSNG